MSNQDVGADADQLPKDEHHDKVVGQDDAQHREEEKRQPGEVAPIALFMSHVANRVDEDQRAIVLTTTSIVRLSGSTIMPMGTVKTSRMLIQEI